MDFFFLCVCVFVFICIRSVLGGGGCRGAALWWWPVWYLHYRLWHSQCHSHRSGTWSDVFSVVLSKRQNHNLALHVVSTTGSGVWIVVLSVTGTNVCTAVWLNVCIRGQRTKFPIKHIKTCRFKFLKHNLLPL